MQQITRSKENGILHDLYALDGDDEEEYVAEKLRPRDHLLVMVEQKDIWIKINTEHTLDKMKFVTNFVVKVDVKWNGLEIKAIIQKLVLSIWNRLISETSSMTSQISKQMAEQLYVLSDLTIHRLHKRNAMNETMLSQTSRRSSQASLSMMN